jgi:protein-tyrosine phosphatase
VARRVEPSSPLKKLGQKKPGPAGESKITLFLVGGLEHDFCFYILGISSSQLTNSYFSEGLKPPVLYWKKSTFFLEELKEKPGKLVVTSIGRI